MNVDLSINETGDLLFMEKPDSLQPQKISFSLSHSKAQKISINFYDVETVKHNSNNYLKIEFFIDKSKPNIIASTCVDEESLRQLIALKIKTCLGELPERSDFGSKLTLFRHESITDSILKSLEKYLEAILANDILAVSVQATPEVDYNNGYKQSININIFSNEKLLLDYKLER